MTDDAESDKQQRINYIRNLYAFDLFVQHRFEESLRIFAELKTGQYCATKCFQLANFKIVWL